MFRSTFLLAGLLVVTVFFFAAAVFSEASVNCEMCHGELGKQKNVHAALKMGCVLCHSNVDATDVPHKVANNAVKGLSSAQPDLCYKCHKKDLFAGMKQMHSPVVSGVCTVCHNPHGSENEKLLTNDLPDLCYNCHDRTKFEGEVIHQPAKIGLCTNCHSPHQANVSKLLSTVVPDICYQCHQKDEYTRKNIHMPVAGGCMSCHNAHSSGNEYLLNRKPVFVCLECHPDIHKKPHVLASKQGHPIGFSKKKKKQGNDASRKTAEKEKEFYCASCHNPHSSDWPKLYRYEAQTPFELCQHCHKK